MWMIFSITTFDYLRQKNGGDDDMESQVIIRRILPTNVQW